MSQTVCDWPVSYGSCSNVPEDFEEVREEFERMAIDFLWNLTGQRFGTCPEVVRPCREAGCGRSGISTWWGWGPYPPRASWVSGPAFSGFFPTLVGGKWQNVSCGSCPGSPCSCPLDDGTKAVRLPGPVHSVVEVLVDGEVVPDTSYELRGNVLLRIDGGSWPLTQNLALPATEEDTFQVSYDRGNDVPQAGRLSAGLLAVEFWKEACGDSSCALPSNASTINRQGVTISLDPAETLRNGWTGIAFVDRWVADVNRAAELPRIGVYSPDVRRSSCS